MFEKLQSRQSLSVIGIVAVLLLAGCFQPPGPPEKTPTPTPTAEPYNPNPADITYKNVQPKHEQTLQQEQGYYVRYTVNISDPRNNQNLTYTKTFKVNTRTQERLMASDFTGTPTGKFQDSLLYYERNGNNTTIYQLSKVDEDRQVSHSEAAGKSPLLQYGMNTVEYKLKGTRYAQGDTTFTTYSAQSDNITDYNVTQLLPNNISYNYGDPQVKDESVKSKIIIRNDGLIRSYSFTYTAELISESNQKLKITITYQVMKTSPNLNVEKPDWAKNASSSGS